MKDTNPLERYSVPLRRWWPVVAGALVLGIGAAWLTLPETPSEPTPEEIADPTITYRATYVMLRNPQSPAAPPFELVELLAGQGDLTNRVTDRMDGDVTAMDVDAVILEPNEGIGTLSITAIQPDPDVATRLAATYAEELRTLITARSRNQAADALAGAQERAARLSDQIDELQAEIEPLPEMALERRLLEAELDAALDQYATQQQEIRRLTDEQASPVRPFETLQEPSAVSTLAEEGPSVLEVPQAPVARFVLAVVLALFVGVGAVFAIDHLDTRVRTRRDAEEAFGLPVIASMPRRSSKQRAEHPLPVRSEPDGPTAEAVRALRVSIAMAPTWHLTGEVPAGSDAVGSFTSIPQHGPPRSVLVTSPAMGDGKTTLVANLAADLAQSGQHVLVLDCDFRRPAIAKLFGVPPGPGLRDGSDPTEEPIKDLVVSTHLRGVELVRSGQSAGIAPPWFLTSTATVVEQAVDLADIVLIDTGPLLLTNEAVSLIPSVDTTLLVARAGRVRYRQAREAVERLTRVGAKVGGVALIGGEGSHRYGYYEVPVKSPQTVQRGGSRPGGAATPGRDVTAGS